MAHYEPTKMLRLVLALTPPHMEDEEQFLRQLQDQNSPLFHQYLSEQEWNERFAPSAEDEQAVVAWAQRQGLTITQRYPNRLLVDVEGPSAAIEQALDVTINSYQVGEGLYFSNDRDPSIPSALANVVHSVLGLNSFDTMHTFSTYGKKPSYPDYSPGPAYAVGEHIQGKGNIRKLEPARKSTQKSSQPLYSYYGYDPTDLYSSDGYNFQALRSLGHCCNPLNNPQTSPPQSTIAIAIWGDFSNQDLQGFLANYSYLAHNVFRFFVHGTPRCCEPETTLDVEWATAMSNSFGSSASTAAVLVYEGTNGNNSTMLDVLNRVLTDNYARVLSMSWGGAENYEVPASDMESYHAVFNQLSGEGWTIVAASGDGGATSDCADHLSVFYPESDPDVTSVGGTTLYTDVGNYSSEAAWGGGPYGCSTNDGGSGGGCSAHFGAPAYQSGGTACSGNRRSVPDLALNADGLDTPQNFFYEGYMQPTGGTSIAAPEMAGFFAQENAYLLYIQSLVGHTCGSSGSAPCTPLGNANWDIYYEGLHQTAAHYPFYDIANGCNNNDITRQDHLSFFCAGHGFDRVTGWGSANMLQLAWTLNSFLADDDEGPNVSISGPPVNQWYMADQTLSWTLTDTSGNGHRPNGVAGSSLAWDADPGDPYHQPTPGNGNNYYGPQFFGETGSASGLSQLSQGCHTAFVRGWDNT
ncbi:MAG: S53 family peptidase, partial [Candidatus Korobacteraceae bacterium]